MSLILIADKTEFLPNFNILIFLLYLSKYVKLMALSNSIKLKNLKLTHYNLLIV